MGLLSLGMLEGKYYKLDDYKLRRNISLLFISTGISHIWTRLRKRGISLFRNIERPTECGDSK